MTNNNIKLRKNKYLNENEKYYIEGRLQKYNNFGIIDMYDDTKIIKINKNIRKIQLNIIKEIANELNRSVRTIDREIKRGLVKQIDYLHRAYLKYSAYKSISLRNEIKEKLENNLNLDKIEKTSLDFLLNLLKRNYSPYSALILCKKYNHKIPFNLKTLYNYINLGYFESFNIKSSNLPYKKQKKIKRINSTTIKRRIGKSIELRSDKINKRQEYGHWEIDCVVGSKKGVSTSLLVLTERVTRFELIFKLKERKSIYVEKILENLLKSKKYKILSITSDNGSEFISIRKDFEKKFNIDWFYAHPFSSGERGSNENNNKLIRKFIKKGSNIGNISLKKLKYIEDFINNYPRKLFYGKSSKEVLNEIKRIS